MQTPRPQRSRSARRRNIILAMHGMEPGVVGFDLFIGNPSALPQDFLREHCRPWRAEGPLALRLVYRLSALVERLCGSFPDVPTHSARFCYTYDSAKGLAANGLHQNLSTAYAQLRQAGFLLLGGLGMAGTWSPEEEYAYRLSIGAESNDFPVILPSRERRHYALTSVREREAESHHSCPVQTAQASSAP